MSKEITAPGLTLIVQKSSAGRGKARPRRYHCLHTVHLDRPGVRYAAAGLGVFWVSPYEHEHGPGGVVKVQYGDDPPGRDTEAVSPTAPLSTGSP
ncbi:hypothetical protein C1J01_10765 [Nonomuraea aridisoli]|uniref:Uncharacterized protein n=1 Tax=Nonomuraea aridisoli TaxID=2070368 RepID=A0A2W2FYM7_9ACTN|nr:hypothetical protein C1J01_10765 [Nonomuraea aridisoli]